MHRSGQAADREDITRQAGSRRQAANGQSRVGSPGKQEKRSECQPGQNKTSQWVSVCVLLICECVNEVQVW